MLNSNILSILPNYLDLTKGSGTINMETIIKFKQMAHLKGFRLNLKTKKQDQKQDQ